MDFNSLQNYKKWLSYIHATGKAKTPGHQKVFIKGKPKQVKHDLGGNMQLNYNLSQPNSPAMNAQFGYGTSQAQNLGLSSIDTSTVDTQSTSSGLGIGSPEMMALQAVGGIAKGAAASLDDVTRLATGVKEEDLEEFYNRNQYTSGQAESAKGTLNTLGSLLSLDPAGALASGMGVVEQTKSNIDLISESKSLNDYDKTLLKANEFISKVPGAGILATPLMSKAAKRLNQETNQSFLAEKYAATRSNTPITLNALGGKLSNMQTVEQFNPDLKLVSYDTGGKHSDNPIGGIPQGVDSTGGSINTVEQGETRVGDYIFSNRTKLNTPGDFGLGNKLKNKTHADASKQLYKEFEERPNDAIAKRTWMNNISKLIAANEISKLDGDNNQMACGGKLKK